MNHILVLAKRALNRLRIGAGLVEPAMETPVVSTRPNVVAPAPASSVVTPRSTGESPKHGAMTEMPRVKRFGEGD